ncbi:hypothetical protein [Butyricimonas synergistica]|uniref:hypothetical protein n=1 Tax=Butyricimonas synergistica TaxID=544644 RepID=UPI0022E3269D|nr:hypothetical protein [Butyricimonas synergistica]
MDNIDMELEKLYSKYGYMPPIFSNIDERWGMGMNDIYGYYGYVDRIEVCRRDTLEIVETISIKE